MVDTGPESMYDVQDSSERNKRALCQRVKQVVTINERIRTVPST
jgi:hypothetical protein